MSTELAKMLRKIRIDHDERILNMAEKLGVSSAFISSVELGKTTPPKDFEEKIIKAYGLDDSAANALRSITNRSRSTFKISVKSPLARDMVGLLAFWQG